MNKTSSDYTTPGGRPVTENPHSSESGPMDSGGGHELLNRTTTEINLSNPSQGDFHREWIEEKRERLKLQKIVCDMQKHINTLQMRIKSLSCNQDDPEIEYHTDEEQLARETDWILAKNKKSRKRKAEGSPEEPIENNPIRKTIARLKKKGKTAEKSPSDSISVLTGKKIMKEFAPPPIMVHHIEVFSKLKQIVCETTKEECKYTSYNNNVWKVNVANSDIYRKITEELTKNKIQWHSYENRSLRPIRVMARGLHPSCEESEICSDLMDRGFKIVEAKNILTNKPTAEVNGKNITGKMGLPLFMLTFNNEESLDKIYAIKAIMGIKVKIEPLRKTTNRIPQCKRCQAFGHTQHYCSKDFACVKCAGNHPTKNCTVNKEQKAKCVNCHGEHPANYRGCIIAKVQQKRKDELAKNNTRKTVPMPKPVRKTKSTTSRVETKNKTDSIAENKKSFAEVIKNSAQKKHRDVDELLSLILKRLDDQESVLTTLIQQLRVDKNQQETQPKCTK